MNKKELAEQIAEAEKLFNKHWDIVFLEDTDSNPYYSRPKSLIGYQAHKAVIAAIIEAMGEKPEAEAEKGVEQLVEQMSYKFHNKHWFTDIEWESIKAFGVEVCKTALRELNSMNRAASNAVNQNFSRVLQQAHDMLFVLEMLCKDDDWQVYDAVDEDFKNLRDLAKKAIKKQSVEAMGVQPGMSEEHSSITLINALLSGKTLIKNHVFDNTEELWCEVGQIDGRKYFYIRGWGTAYGKAEDRLMDIIQHPEKWSIELQNHNSSNVADNQEAIEPKGEGL